MTKLQSECVKHIDRLFQVVAKMDVPQPLRSLELYLQLIATMFTFVLLELH